MKIPPCGSPCFRRYLCVTLFPSVPSVFKIHSETRGISEFQVRLLMFQADETVWGIQWLALNLLQ